MVKIFLVMTGVFFIGVAARAQGDIEQRSEQQKLIEKAVEQCSQIIGQFGSRAKAAKESVSGAVKSCTDCATIMRELAEKKRLSVRLRLGARYFEKEFGRATRIKLPAEYGAFVEFCDNILKEMKLWAVPEPTWSYDHVWAGKARSGLERVKGLLPGLKKEHSGLDARKNYEETAALTISAGKEAEMVADRVGSFGFPAWQLKFAVRYFMAATFSAVSETQESSKGNLNDWQQADARLRKAVEPLAGQIDELLATLP